MDTITIDAASRETGKKAAKQVRKAGNVPCVLYGHHTDPVSFQVEELVLNKLIYTNEMHIVQITVDGQSYDCILKDTTFHPITDRTTHADFQVLEKGSLVTVTVPVQFHGTPAGQKDGGDTQYNVHELTVRCLPKDIPGHIDVDVAHLTIGDSIHISDLGIEGVEFADAEGRTVVTVVPPRMVEEEETDEVAAPLAEGEEAPEGEEGAEGEEEEAA